MPYGKTRQTQVQLCHARGVLRQQVAALLRGSGLQIRERAGHLAITNPRDRDQGQIHISYTTGEVSWQHTTWHYLGPLQGHEPDDDPDREPPVDATRIIAALTGSHAPGQPQ